MTLPARWHTPPLTALRLQPMPLGLPHGYAVMLIGVSAFLFAYLHEAIAAGWIAFFGWIVGRWVTARDPFGWAIMAKNLSLPKQLG